MDLNSETAGRSNSLRIRFQPPPPHQVLLRRRPPPNSISRLAWCMFLIVLAGIVFVLLPSKMGLILYRKPFELEAEKTPHLLVDVTPAPGFRSPAESGQPAAYAGKVIFNNVSVREGTDRVPASAAPPTISNVRGGGGGGPYHDWELFAADYKEMMSNLKIFVYPDATRNGPPSPYDSIFKPLPEAFKNPKLGNYFSEHAFKVALLRSPLVTKDPEKADFFFMPFSINAMRNHPKVHSANSISNFIAEYTTNVSSQFPFWNASGGADHFYAYCHSIGRDSASKHPDLHNNAIQATCSSSYFQRLYTTHKDISLPQVWPRQQDHNQAICQLPESKNRDKLIFFAGRAQNSLIRERILNAWSNDTSLAISSSAGSHLQYEEGFKTSKYCLHIKGYEVNTARISDAIHYGCIPVIISNYYDLPLADVLDWKEFSIIIHEVHFKQLKQILLSISQDKYQRLYNSLCRIRRHFAWHPTPTSYDAFYMTAYQLWLRRGLIRLAK